MTLREEIEAKIDSIKKKSAEDIAALQAHLDGGGLHLDQQLHQVEAWFGDFVREIKSRLGYGSDSDSK